MQYMFDLFEVYYGNITDFIDKEDEQGEIVGVIPLTVATDESSPDGRFHTTVIRSQNENGAVDTVYVTDRAENGQVAAYIEFSLGSDRFEAFINPSYRRQHPSVIFELERENGASSAT